MLQAIITNLESTRRNWRLFTLTVRPEFFLSLGFKLVSRELFPEKIWNDCSKCPKIDHCDEVALLLESGQCAGEKN